MKTEERFEKVINYFSEAMPVAETELEYTDPYELIVAVILSFTKGSGFIPQIRAARMSAVRVVDISSTPMNTTSSKR